MKGFPISSNGDRTGNWDAWVRVAMGGPLDDGPSLAALFILRGVGMRIS
jgi:hypothetical protein